ncbi:MAG TPA: Hpt domain-containing protein [Burkholderiales bacterium]|nr:Hpt domain-containing protein [Burkholderiales bacterium]
MAVPAQLLSFIKTEVDYALKLVRDSIAKFTAAPEDVAALGVCPGQLHQVTGALRIVGLNGATRFSETIEGSFTGLAQKRPSKATIEVIDRAVLALKEYVDDLARGQPDAPLRLFPTYRELGSLQGKSDLSERDLFFPDLEPQPPAHPNPKKLSVEQLGPYLQGERARFQRGLLGMLRNQPDGVKEMNAALDGFYQVAAQLPEPRALWWVAQGLVEGLAKAPDAEWVATAKSLSNKIDFQMRDLAAGSGKVNDLLLRDIMYLIAKTKPVSNRLREVRHLYRLDSLFPAAPSVPGLMEFDLDWLGPALEDLRSRLEAMKGGWVEYISAEQGSAARFRELVTSFKAKAKDLGNQHLAKLLDAISLVAARLPDPYPPTGQLMVIEMASAFLLVEHVIETLTDPVADLEQQIAIMGGWLLDAAKGKSTGEPPPGMRADLSQQVGALQLRAQVSKEILTNLQHVEQALDAFARDPAKRATLPALKPHLRQINGALYVLRFQRAAEALALCEAMINECAKPDYAGADDDMDWIAEGLSSIGFYLDPCVHGREPGEQAIKLFFDRIKKRGAAQAAPQAQPAAPAAAPAAKRANEDFTLLEAAVAAMPDMALDAEPSTVVMRAPLPAEATRTVVTHAPAATEATRTVVLHPSLVRAERDTVVLNAPVVPAEEPTVTLKAPVPLEAPAPPPAAKAPAAPQPAADTELLAIFLEEAGEVLASIDEGLGICREEPQNFDQLTRIRRGFHTLKGSGRMVGLMGLGEVAWEIEQVMNQHLERKEQATKALLDLIMMASASFTEWVGQLRENKPLVLKGEHIVDFARKVKAGEVTAAVHEAPAALRAARPAAEFASEPVMEPVAEPAIEPLIELELPDAAEAPPPAADVQAIMEAVEALEPLEFAPAPAPAPAAAPELVVEDEDVEIDGVRLSRAFFEIYVSESVQHVAMLEAEYTGWRATPGSEASHEFLRAAHTLASSSRTAGFPEIADLAGAVEHWIPYARHVVEESEARAVQTAIVKLREMVDAVTQCKPATAAKKEVSRLQELTDKLQSALIPPVTSEAADERLTIAKQPKTPAASSEPLTTSAKPPRTSAGPLTTSAKPPRTSAGPLTTSARPPRTSAGPLTTSKQPITVSKASPAPAPAPSGKELRKIHDDIDPQLLPIFLEEAQELLPHLGSDLRELKANPADEKVTQSLMRVLHTFKGSARMAGAIRLGELTHLMESRLEAAIEAKQFSAELFEELESKMDRLSLDLERMRTGEPLTSAKPVAAPTAPGEAPQEAPARAEAPLAGPAAMLRVNADTLDQLINGAGEVGIARSRIEAELRMVKQTLTDLNDSITRMRGQLREVEIQAESQMQSRAAVAEEQHQNFDPLEFDRYTRLQELTRLMAESLHDVTSIQQTLIKSLGETDAALLAQARTSRDVQQELMRMRAVPFANLDERLYRIVRQVARELDKKAELVIEGSEVELDRSVLEKVGAPLEHMLRNSLGHGLEMPAARVADGKPETGRINITLRQESNEIALIVSDDGAGLDLGKLHRKAVERGIMHPGKEPTEAELMQLVFASGLSTAETVTELSGRGVGMDVVRNDIASIGGRIDIATARGKGTTFTVYLPLTLAVTQAVLVRSGNSVLAVSSAMVEQVLRLKSDALAAHYEKKVIESQDRQYPLHYIQLLLGTAEPTETQAYTSVLLLRSGIQRIALHVDEMLGNQEIVVKSVGPQLARVPGVGGATVLPDGRIALIINPVQLAQRLHVATARVEAEQPAAAAAAPARPTTPIILVVDDSLTVRKITGRLLEREGYQVLTAKDGVEALEQIRDILPSVMLVDIEMPRMDGFELTRNVRADPRTQDIPIIIISSRTADKHREQAAQLGVNEFLGKPYQEAELLGHIARFIAVDPQTTIH